MFLSLLVNDFNQNVSIVIFCFIGSDNGDSDFCADHSLMWWFSDVTRVDSENHGDQWFWHDACCGLRKLAKLSIEWVSRNSSILSL